ncbi:pentatricopeptide repeat-containing protein At3g26630, chloroplastic [Neltuma alba]|uniref:pentatricopeptide repeat-containing protein At3g26630, chloroplastic n=1 Tax=Neltuma alba TaxID=207710 RepID=UPI0010A3E90B|nr:pentatricopeptide repeat-containing protein At3g26630, chloroplastic [Prosopis alba]
MKVVCLSCTPHTLPSRTPNPKFGSKEALLFLRNSASLKQLKQIHGKIIRFGHSHDQLLVRKLLHLSSSYGDMDYATVVFNQIKALDTFTCNVMIRAYTISGSHDQALHIFTLMLCQGPTPDKFTFPFVINTCLACCALAFGKVVHALAIKMGFSSDIYLQNTLMNLYLKCGNTEGGYKVFDKMRGRSVVSWTTMISGLAACGQLDEARRIFEQMPSKNVVSWTAMIDGYVKDQQPIEAFRLFQRMQLENVMPNEFTVVCLIKACTEVGSLKLGKWVHDFALKNGFDLGIFMGTALIDMYSKCGSLEDAMRVFHKMPTKGLATWNSMITSLGVHGMGNEALSFFQEMENTNVAPDAITFVGVLNACVHINDLEKAEKYFNLMTEHYGITPVMEHYKCMIELYSRANRLDEIYSLLKPNCSTVLELIQERKAGNSGDKNYLSSLQV